MTAFQDEIRRTHVAFHQLWRRAGRRGRGLAGRAV